MAVETMPRLSPPITIVPAPVSACAARLRVGENSYAV